MRLTKIYILLLIIITTWLSACKDCGYNYTYEIQNGTNSNVKIFWTQMFYSPDSLTLEPGETKEFFTIGHGIEPCHEIAIFRDVDYDLESFKVVKMDSVNVESNSNYLSNDSWEFIDGSYQATITESEF
ncbi:MAG: hypothetical protein P8P74_07665 [Crocinitomicaceae bacterium]|nr:hypothetical protein [Crocinitomicaceae bacterium]